MFLIGRTPIGRGASHGDEDAVFVLSLAPVDVVSSYGFDGAHITIQIVSLPGVTAANANASTGDWRQLFQALCLITDDWLAGMPVASKPLAIRSFMLEDWRRKDPKFGRHMKRSFAFDFTTKYPLMDVTEE
jgi:hypothetical protein